MGRARGRRAVVVACCAGLLVGCSGSPGPAPTISPTVVADKTEPPEPVVPDRWPLTGVEAEVVSRPAISVKIENTPQARPQAGLEGADLVWENIVEFGVPRFVVVFHSTLPEEVGPIRSIRPVDARIVTPLGGLLAFSGGQQGIVSLLRRTGLQMFSEDDGDPGFSRVSSRPRPHNVYGSLETFLEEADDEHSEPPREQFAFANRPGGSAAARLGTPARRIDLVLSPLSRPSWTWDAAGGRWLRSEGGRAALSADDERLAATNVVVLRVGSFDSGFDAQQGAPVPDLRLEGQGEGLVASGGRTLEITWSKEAREDPVTLTGPDGEVAALEPGNTWIELVPRPGGSFTVE